jgi:tRNA-2-methylthio-N6-dimethylallyladenosine synthase
MEGCSKACTFCIVPSTRGVESCRTPEAILEEARAVIGAGYLEIELLGQNVNAYRSAGWDFTRLLSAVSRLDGLSRLRFTTSHPLHFKNSIADLMSVQPVICPHVHLPFQSGSDRVLKVMRRGYTRQEFLSRVSYARKRVPGLALSTDVIVGFPGEREDDFLATLDVIREVRFNQVYAFLYSRREGTPAAGLDDDQDRDVKAERLQRLMRVQDGIQEELHRQHVGRIEEVLVEGPSAKRPTLLSGRSPSNRVIVFEGSPALTGRLVRVRITDSGANTLRGALEPREMALPPLTSLNGRDITAFGTSISGENPS